MQKNIALIGGIAIIAILGIFTWQKKSAPPITVTPPASETQEVDYMPISEGEVEVENKNENESESSAETSKKETSPSPETTVVPATETTTTPPTTVESPKPTTKTLTATEVATHNSETDCYTIVDGSVYNLTSWISQHPGGSRAILGLCGKDGTEAFTKKHSTTAKAKATLTSFYIADLSR